MAYGSQDNTYNVVKSPEVMERKRSSKSCSAHTVKVDRIEKVGDSDALKQVIKLKTQSGYDLLNVLQ